MAARRPVAGALRPFPFPPPPERYELLTASSRTRASCSALQAEAALLAEHCERARRPSRADARVRRPDLERDRPRPAVDVRVWNDGVSRDRRGGQFGARDPAGRAFAYAPRAFLTCLVRTAAPLRLRHLAAADRAPALALHLAPGGRRLARRAARASATGVVRSRPRPSRRRLAHRVDAHAREHARAQHARRRRLVGRRARRRARRARRRRRRRAGRRARARPRPARPPRRGRGARRRGRAGRVRRARSPGAGAAARRRARRRGVAGRVAVVRVRVAAGRFGQQVRLGEHGRVAQRRQAGGRARGARGAHSRDELDVGGRAARRAHAVDDERERRPLGEERREQLGPRVGRSSRPCRARRARRDRGRAGPKQSTSRHGGGGGGARRAARRGDLVGHERARAALADETLAYSRAPPSSAFAAAAARVAAAGDTTSGSAAGGGAHAYFALAISVTFERRAARGRRAAGAPRRPRARSRASVAAAAGVPSLAAAGVRRSRPRRPVARGRGRPSLAAAAASARSWRMIDAPRVGAHARPRARLWSSRRGRSSRSSATAPRRARAGGGAGGRATKADAAHSNVSSRNMSAARNCLCPKNPVIGSCGKYAPRGFAMAIGSAVRCASARALARPGSPCVRARVPARGLDQRAVARAAPRAPAATCRRRPRCRRSPRRPPRRPPRSLPPPRARAPPRAPPPPPAPPPRAPPSAAAGPPPPPPRRRSRRARRRGAANVLIAALTARALAFPDYMVSNMVLDPRAARIARSRGRAARRARARGARGPARVADEAEALLSPSGRATSPRTRSPSCGCGARSSPRARRSRARGGSRCRARCPTQGAQARRAGAREPRRGMELTRLLSSSRASCGTSSATRGRTRRSASCRGRARARRRRGRARS